MILHALEKVASEKGFSVDNYGMYLVLEYK